MTNKLKRMTRLMVQRFVIRISGFLRHGVFRHSSLHKGRDGCDSWTEGEALLGWAVFVYNSQRTHT